MPEDIHACAVATILQHPVCASTLCEDVALFDLTPMSCVPYPVCAALHNSLKPMTSMKMPLVQVLYAHACEKQFDAMHIAVLSHQTLLTASPGCPALHF